MGSVKLGDYNLEQCGYDPFVGYASSKTANIWMANELERRYGSQGLHSISVHPGGIETGFQASHAEEPAKMIAASKCLTEFLAQHVTLAKSSVISFSDPTAAYQAGVQEHRAGRSLCCSGGCR